MIESWYIVVISLFAVLGGIIGIMKFRKADGHEESGIAAKYSKLCQLLKVGGKIEAERLTPKSISFKIRTHHDTHGYVLTEVDGRMIAVWTLESSIHGRRGKEWSFNVNYDQSKMFEEIQNDLKVYQLSLHREMK